MAGGFFDTTAIGHSSDDHDTRRAEAWLRNVETKTHALLDSWPSDPGVRSRPRSVKIAVIDTGIDAKHPAFRRELGRNGRIQDRRWWTEDGQLQDEPGNDTAGHGSHVTALLMRLAPWARIHVARVAENTSEVGAKAVAKAIAWATTDWEVDIISMSLGFDLDQECITDAIREARRHNILLFAAASNDGNNKKSRFAFPARLHDVHCVSATNSFGTELAAFNPSLTSSDYCTLGISVPSAWPLMLKSGGRMSLSGTSMATPILAATAALAIHFLRQLAIERPSTLHDEDFWSWLAGRIHTPEGIKTMLDLMRGGNLKDWCYVAPWLLLDVDAETTPTRARQEVAAKLWNGFKPNYNPKTYPQVTKADFVVDSEAVKDTRDTVPKPWKPDISFNNKLELSHTSTKTVFVVLSCAVAMIAFFWTGLVPIPSLNNPDQSGTPAVSLMHFTRNPDFVGREEILTSIDTALSGETAIRRVALTGLGGIGKSQIALEYAYREKNRNASMNVFWVSGASVEAFRRDYQAVASALQLSQSFEHESKLFVQVLQWLQDESHGPWLMIVDNADNSTFITGDDPQESPGPNTMADVEYTAITYLPRFGKGSILFTTRNETLAHVLTGSRPQRVVRIEPLSEDEALGLIYKTLSPSHLDESDALELANELELIPLAITQAAAYLMQRPRVSAAQYISWLQHDESCESLLDSAYADLERYPEGSIPVLKTWQISMNQINSTHPNAASILAHMSVIDHQSIPAYLWTGPSSLYHDDYVLIHGRSDIVDVSLLTFEQNIGVLLDFALVRQQEDPGLFDIHRLVQVATRMWLTAAGRNQHVQESVLGIVAAKYPQTSQYISDTSIIQILEPHARVLLDLPFSSRQALLDIALLQWRRGLYYYSVWGLDAESMMRPTVQAYIELLGKAHHASLVASISLADVIYQLRGLDEALVLARQTSTALRKKLGLCHYDTLSALGTLAMILLKQGNAQEAVAQLQTPLTVCEQTTTCMTQRQVHARAVLAFHMALLCRLRECTKQTEVQLDASLSILEFQHDLLFPWARMMLLRARSFRLLVSEQFDEASKAMKQALEISLQLSGPDTSDYITQMEILARTLRHSGDYPAAIQLLLEISWSRAIGPTRHTEIRDAMIQWQFEYGIRLLSEHDFSAAESVLQRCREGAIQSWGAEHEIVARVGERLMLSLMYQHKYEMVLEIVSEELAILTALYGADSREGLASLQRVAVIKARNLLYTKGSGWYGLGEAKKYAQQALDLGVQLHGSASPDVFPCLLLLARIWLEMGHIVEARELIEEAELLSPSDSFGSKATSLLGALKVDVERMSQEHETWASSRRLYVPGSFQKDRTSVGGSLLWLVSILLVALYYF